MRLTSEPTGSVTLTLAGNTAEYTTLSPVTFTAGNWSTAQTVVVTGKDDFVDDGDITYSVSLTATSSDTGYSTKSSSVTVVNLDNDTAGISVSSVGNTSESGCTAAFNVRLTSEPTGDVTISLSGDDSEGTLSSSSLIFNATNWSTNKSVTVTGKDDFIDDGKHHLQCFASRRQCRRKI